MATVPFAFNWYMRAHVETLATEYRVTVVTSGTRDDIHPALDARIGFVSIPFQRKPSIPDDFRALWQLWRLFRHDKFDVVHSIMPKSGLLAMIAARLSGVPVRLHTFTGQVWATRRGAARRALQWADRLMARSATRVLADSHSQRAFLIENGIADPRRIDVLADGSVTGVDLRRFTRDDEARRSIRLQHGVPGDAVVFLFVGRLTRDKGVSDLLAAFESVAARSAADHLFVVGPDEEGLDASVAALAARIPGRVHRVGFSDHPEAYMSAADVICLPSYREGFGTVIIEAAAVGLPAVASRIYGVIDAVEDGTTGILHRPGAVDEIGAALERLASDPSLRMMMGRGARARAVARFSQERICGALLDYYRTRARDAVHG